MNEISFSTQNNINKENQKIQKNKLLLFLLFFLLILSLAINLYFSLSKKKSLTNDYLQQNIVDEQKTNIEDQANFFIKQISSLPPTINLKKDFSCNYAYQIDEKDLNEFEFEIYNKYFSQNSIKSGIFCSKSGDKILISYVDNEDETLILLEQNPDNLNYTEKYLFKDSLGSVDIMGIQLISWDDNEIIFAAKENKAGNNLQKNYMFVYYLDLESLDYAEPKLKILEACEYAIAPGTSKRVYTNCTNLESKEKSSYLDEEKLW